MIPVAPFPGQFECKYFDLQTIDVKGGWSMFCSGEKSNPAATQLLYVISSDKAVIRTSEEKVGKTIAAEEIYAVLPGDKVSPSDQLFRNLFKSTVQTSETKTESVSNSAAFVSRSD